MVFLYENQTRRKISSLLGAAGKGALYILDEPTTGLHSADCQYLLDVLVRLRDKGNSILLIEHNLEMIKNADWIIDLGPEGGEKGGSVIAVGTPMQVSKNPNSFTGQYLRKILRMGDPGKISSDFCTELSASALVEVKNKRPTKRHS